LSVIRSLSRLALPVAAAVALVGLAAPAAQAAPTAAAGPAAAPAVSAHHLLGLTHAVPHTAGRTQAAQSSLNWSGYIKPGSSGAFTSSTASWTVPTLSTTYNGYSSTWVGVDGATSGDQYLIQTGTEADVVGHRTSYDAWYEVITPTDEAPETIFTSLTISPGDHIKATVAKTSSTSWKMTLTDNTTGRSASHTSAFAGPGESAEWIQEDTDVNGYISAAPDWKSVSFSGITVNGAGPALTASESVDIVDNNGTQEDSTGNPTGSSNGFTVTWLAPGTRTYVG
jgi:hypothetical protein